MLLLTGLIFNPLIFNPLIFNPEPAIQSGIMDLVASKTTTQEQDLVISISSNEHQLNDERAEPLDPTESYAELINDQKISTAPPYSIGFYDFRTTLDDAHESYVNVDPVPPPIDEFQVTISEDSPHDASNPPSVSAGDCETLENCHTVLQSEHTPKASELDGTFLQAQSLPSSQISGFFDEIHDLGMEIVILQNVRTKGDGCVGEDCCEMDDYQWLSGFPAKLDMILENAAVRDIQVYVGLDLTSHDICPMAFYKEPNSSLTIEDTRKTVLQLEELHGSHAALAGWYIPDEPSLSEWIQPSLAYSYYSGLVNSIRLYSTKPILISPHLTNITSLSPEELAWRAQSFKQYTGVDILLWQDNAGTEGLKMAWDPISSTIGEYLQQITSLLGADSTWSVHEAFNCCVKYSQTETGASYHPASMVRFSEQLAQAIQASVGKRITWIQQHHFGTVDPYHHMEADRLLNAYQAYFDISGEFLMPERYIWITEPDTQYADDSYEMFNWKISDPNDFTNAEWVGINGNTSGNAEIVIEFGEERVVEWIGFHILSNPKVGIHFPEDLTLTCYSEDQLWQGIDRWILPIKPDSRISEYVFANTQPLSKTCSKIKATLIGSQWIFLSEIEIVAEELPKGYMEEIWTSDILLP